MQRALKADYEKRRERLRSEFRRTGQENLLVTCPFNVTYLTGFTGEDSYLFIDRSTEFLLSDARYSQQIGEECPQLELLLRPSNMSIVDMAGKEAASRSIKRMWVESLTTTVAQWERMRELHPQGELLTSRGLIEHLRERKDPSELAAIQRAIDYAQRAFLATRSLLSPEQTEKQISGDLETNIRRLGATGSAFKTIVGVGPRSALPHGRPSDVKLGTSGFVLIDWGAKEDLYLSDLTRVVVTGKVSPKLEKIYRVVLSAQLAAIDAIRPGVLMSQVDAAARRVIDEAGFGKKFTHGLGHSFGLQIHESVRLSRGQDRPLETDMVVTVEPGIYLPGFGGVRIEDDVLVTKEGHHVLSNLPKTWEECRNF
ncbi:MAG: aminopeptidase P family protein [Planctomycetes bacterium]|nr:aminopeptidase P family protein [Planctomycetota bacterium]